MDGLPLFVVGCGRSGTTMLRLMLDSHPDLAIPGESHFIRDFYRQRSRYLRSDGSWDVSKIVPAIMDSPQFRHWELPNELVWQRVNALSEATYPQIISAFFEAYAQHHDKTRWGDKTPSYVRFLPTMLKMFPTARFVHLIRDGRDVALSYLSVPWGPTSIWEAAHKWRNDVGLGRAASKSQDRCLEVRYEALIANPEHELRRICEFVDLPYDPRMLSFHRGAESRLESEPTRKQFHSSVTKVPSSGLRDWRNQMSAHDLAAFESVAGRLLSELGYERQHQAIPWHWQGNATLRMAVIEARIAGSRVKRKLREARTSS